MRNIPTAEKENQRVTPDWAPILDPIDGVKVREVNMMPDHSYVSAYSRQEWEFCKRPVQHILQVTLCPRAMTDLRRPETS